MFKEEVNKVNALTKTIEVISEEISIINTVGMLTQSLIHKKLSFKNVLLSEEFKTIASEINLFLTRLLDVTQVNIWFDGFDMFSKYWISPNIMTQVFKSEEITQLMKDIDNGHFIDNLNFIEKQSSLLFTDTATNMNTTKVLQYGDGMYTFMKIGKSFIPRSFMLVPLLNRSKRKTCCSILMEFACKKERGFSEDDDWICQNFAMKIASTL